jgi:nicotinamidase-related amidase
MGTAVAPSDRGQGVVVRRPPLDPLRTKREDVGRGPVARYVWQHLGGYVKFPKGSGVVRFQGNLMPTALLLIDIQMGLFMPPLEPHQGDAVVARIAMLLERARTQRTPIFHIRHDGGERSALAKGSPGWFHHPAVAPREDEPVIEKCHSSAFHETDLHAQLSQLGVDHLLIAGLQTEYCVDSACRTAVALGYRVTLVMDGHTTYDTPVLSATQIIMHHNHTLDGSLVDLATAETALLSRSSQQP